MEQTDSQHVHAPVSTNLYRRLRRVILDMTKELRSVEQTMTDPGPEPPGSRAAYLWVTYSVIHLADFAESATELNRDEHARALAVLSRTTYEYLISMIYLFRHRDIADNQMLTQGARFFKRGMGLRLPGGLQSEARYAAAYKAWLADASGSGLDEFTGNFKFLNAALEVEGETKERCPTYTLRYGAMSAVAHPDAEGFPDVFTIDNERRAIQIALQTSLHAFDLLAMIATDLERTMDFLKSAVGLDVPNLGMFKRRLLKVAGEHFNLD